MHFAIRRGCADTTARYALVRKEGRWNIGKLHRPTAEPCVYFLFQWALEISHFFVREGDNFLRLVMAHGSRPCAVVRRFRRAIFRTVLLARGGGGQAGVER